MDRLAVRGTKGRRRIDGIVLAAVLCGVAATADAQAWLRPERTWYAKFSGTYFRTEHEFNYLGDRQEIFAEDTARSDAAYRDMSAGVYVEYGALHYLTLAASTSFKNVRTWEMLQPVAGVEPQPAIRTNYGMSDLWLRGRVAVARVPVAVSVQSGVKIPLGYKKEPENDGPPLGTGEADGDVALNLGYSFWPRPGFAATGVGYRVRGGSLNDEWFYFAEIGYTVARLFLKTRVDALQNTMDPPDIAGFTVITPFPSGVLNSVVVGDQDIFKFNGEASYRFSERMSMYAEFFHIFYGRDTVMGPSFSAGLVFETSQPFFETAD